MTSQISSRGALLMKRVRQTRWIRAVVECRCPMAQQCSRHASPYREGRSGRYRRAYQRGTDHRGPLCAAQQTRLPQQKTLFSPSISHPIDSRALQQEEDPLSQALKRADELMDEVQSQVQGTPAKRRPSGAVRQLASAQRTDAPGVTLQCDVNGCTIVPVTESETSSYVPGTMLGSFEGESEESDVFVFQGKGWKLGVDQRPASTSCPTPTYAAFVSGNGWSISLSHDEYRDFVHLLKNLRRGVATLEVCGDWGAEGSEAQLEMSTPRIWMQGQASQRRLTLLSRLWSRKSFGDEEELPTVAFSLRFIVRTAGTREAEGYWGPDVVMQVLKALDAESSPLTPLQR